MRRTARIADDENASTVLYFDIPQAAVRGSALRIATQSAEAKLDLHVR
jgi:hypothetical protein